MSFVVLLVVFLLLLVGFRPAFWVASRFSVIPPSLARWARGGGMTESQPLMRGGGMTERILYPSCRFNVTEEQRQRANCQLVNLGCVGVRFGNWIVLEVVIDVHVLVFLCSYTVVRAQQEQPEDDFQRACNANRTAKGTPK